MLPAANYLRMPRALPRLAHPRRSVLSGRGGWVALAVARALHFLHAHGVAHLGVAPDCVLLADDGTAVLGDLGAARLLGPHTRAADPARPCHSRLQCTAISAVEAGSDRDILVWRGDRHACATLRPLAPSP